MSRYNFSLCRAVVLIALVCVVGPAFAQKVPLPCDADNNGAIDSKDIALITVARSKPASGPTDPRDPNRDGKIDVLDARFCATQCTLASCAVVPSIPPPVANAGRDQAADVEVLVQLDGTGSTSARGDAITYKWTVSSKPAASSIALTNANSARPTFTIDQVGQYTFQLTVTDAHEVSSVPSTVSVWAGGVNVPPVANAGTYPTAQVGDTVTLDGTHSTDVNGDPLNYFWQFVMVPTGSNNGYPLYGPTYGDPSTFPVDLPGQYYVRLTVTDVHGASSTANAVIDTQPRDHAPMARAGSAQLAHLGRTVTLDGSHSSDPDGDSISGYQWLLLSKPTGSAAQLVNNNFVDPTFVPDKSGDYVVQLIVTANGVNSAPTTVLISTLNIPPVANAGADQTVFVSDPTTLQGIGSDANGDAVSYFWSFLSTPNGPYFGAAPPIQNSDQPSANFIPDVEGDWVAQLVVNDGHGDSVPDTMRIQVQVPTTADLSMSESATTTSPPISSTITFVVTLTNLGRLDARSASVGDLLPTGYQLVAANASQGTYNQVSGTWNVGFLAKNASASLSLTATVLGTGNYTNTATIISSTPGDPNPTNNSASVSVTPVPPANLTLNANVSNSAPVAGSNVTFTLTVRNTGPADATAATLMDLLPSGYQFVSASTPSGTYDSATGQWTIGALANGATATLTITATVRPSGNYTNIATVTAPNSPVNGNTSTSTPVAPLFPPTVSITSPVEGASYMAPATVSLSISAASKSGLVTQVSIFDGTKVLQTVPSNQPSVNYELNLSGVVAGSHTYTVTASDNQGLTTTSNVVHVTVIAPTATSSLIAPRNGAFYVAPATITLLANASSAAPSGVTKVEFFSGGQSLGVVVGPPYNLTLTGIPVGSYQYTAQVTDSTSTVTTAVSNVTVLTTPTIALGNVVDGASFNDTVIDTFTGSVHAPPNSAVDVNGSIGTVAPDGTFFLNNFQLQPGSNPIQIRVATPDGQMSTQYLTVTSTGKAPFQFGAYPTTGVGPLSVTFNFTDAGQMAIDHVDVLCDETGSVSFSSSTIDTTGLPTSLGSCTYPSTGYYVARVNAIDSAGQKIYTASQTIYVAAAVDQEAMIRSVYLGMLERLKAGDTAGALNALTSSVYDKYSVVFNTLQNLPAVVDQLGTIQQGTINAQMAEYVVVRNNNTGSAGFLIYLVLGEDGIWRVDGM